MITLDREIFSSPYYFFMKDNGSHYTLYYSSEETLTEARKKDKMVKIPKDKVEKVEKYLKKVLKSKTKKNTEEIGGEIDELVNADGVLMNSKIPILDPRLHPRKTMDQTIAMTRQTNDPLTRGYRTYFGESDMSGAFGYEETKDLDGEETFQYYKDELEMEPEEAKERTKQQGKDPSGKKDKKSPYYGDEDFITRATISEIQRQKMIKVLEDMITKKKTSDDADIQEKEGNPSNILKKNIKSLKKMMDKEGLTKKDLLKLLDDE
jgi:hypothetical protein